MKINVISLVILLAVAVGIILLQILLSKRENKWAGRILPIIAFLISLIFPLNFAAMGEMTVSFWIYFLFICIMANIPTFILLGIYLACRGKQRKKKQLDKMNIQDLN